MQIQINTDHNIKGTDALMNYFSSELESSLIRVSDHITRIEVHLSDENGQKSGLDDKRCSIETRLEGRKPVAVTHHAATLDKAFDGALDRLVRMIENTLERKENKHKHRDDPEMLGQMLSDDK